MTTKTILILNLLISDTPSVSTALGNVNIRKLFCIDTEKTIPFTGTNCKVWFQSIPRKPFIQWKRDLSGRLALNPHNKLDIRLNQNILTRHNYSTKISTSTVKLVATFPIPNHYSDLVHLHTQYLNHLTHYEFCLIYYLLSTKGLKHSLVRPVPNTKSLFIINIQKL